MKSLNAQHLVDIIVFGASGFTGKYVVEHLARLTKGKYCAITWGIAGRSKEKLQKLIVEINNKGFTHNNILTIESDVENEESLKNMARQARVVINCTGPNILLSPPIVKACIETGTDYVDISAEIIHIIHLYQYYHQLAKIANISVIPSCGFAAIPIEAGMIYLEKQFHGTLKSVECYADLTLPRPGTVVAHTGTWTSFIHVLETFKEYLRIKAELLPTPTNPEVDEPKRPFFFWKNGHLWFPWPGVEQDTVKMSQSEIYKNSGKKPAHFNAYITFPHFYQFLIIPLVFLVNYLCRFVFVRKFLIRFPRLCSLGYMSVKGPSYKVRQNTKFNFLLNGKGWAGDGQECEPKTLTVKVSVLDPAVDSTVLPLILSAITILEERSKIPKGVVMPGAAFYDTSLVSRIKDHCLTIDVLERDENSEI